MSKLLYRTHRFDRGQLAESMVVVLPNGDEYLLQTDYRGRLTIEIARGSIEAIQCASNALLIRTEDDVR